MYITLKKNPVHFTLTKVYHTYYENAIGKCKIWDIFFVKFKKATKNSKNHVKIS